jgi:DNA-binding transcriptional MerR regulator
MKRRGNRRYYQHHEVLLIRRIRELLYEQGFTISGARNRLSDAHAASHQAIDDEPAELEAADSMAPPEAADSVPARPATALVAGVEVSMDEVRDELLSIRSLLSV